MQYLYVVSDGQPEDEGAGDGWRWAGFAAALDADRAEIAAVTHDHPTQRARLAGWLTRVEALGRQRDRDENPATGIYYEALQVLGYAGA